ncbi:MAG: class I SAM-dependent methyltransferase [Chloroflexi bacterium]|nr:MAG: class I SAM-dependent methyltransferase [Chloroflexota bacterium]MBL1197347.1 class I SAM-dependent methyltransferase [Chloroflexota bacterium]NOH14644.1 class I SAM-dependent methyltransferase [Chloroflexota bacterium]
MTTWELYRNWDVVRYLVYYLVENLVPPEAIRGKDVIDFSSGLGDLSAYIASQGPRSLTSTSPAEIDPPEKIAALEDVKFIAGVPAQAIGAKLAPNSADLFVARMVVQFPTVEEDRIDVDGMLAQIYEVLRPGGQLIICSHEFTELDRHYEAVGTSLDDYKQELLTRHSGEHRQYLVDLIELFDTIGVPPREGVHGQTGFGLKALMMVDSLVKAGFHIEMAAEIEDFTFPRGISTDYGERQEYYKQLAEQVFAIKQKHILTPQFENKYQRPQVLQSILKEINALHPFVSVPIFKIRASKPA